MIEKNINLGNWHLVGADLYKNLIWVAGWDVIRETNSENLKPNRIIYNGRTTICYFPDDTKVTVTCSDNEQQFEKEFGVMACIVKKLYGTRSEFLRVVDNGYTQPEPKKKEVAQEVKKEPSKFLRLTKDG